MRAGKPGARAWFNSRLHYQTDVIEPSRRSISSWLGLSGALPKPAILQAPADRQSPIKARFRPYSSLAASPMGIIEI
jgi:hypothetical protein